MWPKWYQFKCRRLVETLAAGHSILNEVYEVNDPCKMISYTGFEREWITWHPSFIKTIFSAPIWLRSPQFVSQYTGQTDRGLLALEKCAGKAAGHRFQFPPKLRLSYSLGGRGCGKTILRFWFIGILGIHGNQEYFFSPSWKESVLYDG